MFCYERLMGESSKDIASLKKSGRGDKAITTWGCARLACYLNSI